MPLSVHEGNSPALPAVRVAMNLPTRPVTGLLALLAFVIAACGSAASPPPSIEANQPILLVTQTGGFVPAESRLTRFPIFALYGDGRVIIQGPQVALYPGPALPNLQVLRLTSAGINTVIAAAQAAGLAGPDRILRADNVADAPSTVFVLNWAGGTHRTTAEALFESAAAGADRLALQALVSQLQDPLSWLGEAIATPEAPFQPAALRIVARPSDPSQGTDPQLANVVGWPLSGSLGTLGEEVAGGSSGRCAVLTGDEMQTVLRAAGQSNKLTYWRSGGATFRVDFRPLYPHETGCTSD